MVLFEGGFAVIAFAVWIFCIIDVITTPEAQVRNLPKLLWLLIVVLLVDIGSIAWLVAGRPWAERAAAAAGRRTGATGRPPARATNPDDDEEFLAGLRARAEQQRRRAARDAAQPATEPPAVEPRTAEPPRIAEPRTVEPQGDESGGPTPA